MDEFVRWLGSGTYSPRQENNDIVWTYDGEDGRHFDALADFGDNNTFVNHLWDNLYRIEKVSNITVGEMKSD